MVLRRCSGSVAAASQAASHEAGQQCGAGQAVQGGRRQLVAQLPAAVCPARQQVGGQQRLQRALRRRRQADLPLAGQQLCEPTSVGVALLGRLWWGLRWGLVPGGVGAGLRGGHGVRGRGAVTLRLQCQLSQLALLVGAALVIGKAHSACLQG